MGARRRGAAAVLATALSAAVVAGLALAGCTGSSPTPEPSAAPQPVQPQWQAVSLPAPPGTPGRTMVRDATFCGSRWYVSGALITPEGETRPALWSTTDASAAGGWQPVPIDATDYYALRAVLYAIGCRDGKLAIVGARGGGAHGNPRVRTFYERPDGVLQDVPSTDFQLYGGPDAVSVNRIAGGTDGWLIAGNRRTGAAVWSSPDAHAFTLLEGAPVLASGGGLTTAATDVVPVDGGWLVSGSARRSDRIDRDPTTWTSPDGRAWTRVGLPSTAGDEDAQRLVRTPDGMVALGVAGGGFAAWRGDGVATAGGEWVAAGRFGTTGTGAVAGVDSAALLDGPGRLVATTLAADGHGLWTADLAATTWNPVELPTRVPPGGDTAAAVAAHGETMLLLTDDGSRGAVYVATFPPS